MCYLSQERNSRKGKFSASKLKGKRVIELGAGCGVAGFGMALLGCNVVTTDQTEVLPLLMRNVERNTSRIMQANSDSDSFGTIHAAELDWGNMDHVKAVGPPFDFIIGTDVVYKEHLLEPLLQTMLALSDPKTTIVIGYEIRSTNVHEQMLNLWKKHFEVKIVPRAKMDNKYQHPSIQLFIMTLKPSGLIRETTSLDNSSNSNGSEITTNVAIDNTEDEYSGNNSDEAEVPKVICCNRDDVSISSIQNGKLSDWEARRVGSMAARLLRDVKLS